MLTLHFQGPKSTHLKPSISIKQSTHHHHSPKNTTNANLVLDSVVDTDLTLNKQEHHDSLHK